ncbi:hypothetical protein KY389_05925 [Paracoccus bogoriensis]|nr:hypothetical protein [Paracoccus bogoriensis]
MPQVRAGGPGGQARHAPLIEHFCGVQSNGSGGTLVCRIGLIRAKARIGMRNLAGTMRRLVRLRRLNPCPA